MKLPPDITLDDEKSERVRRAHVESIKELQRALPTVVSGVTLADATATYVAHGLGREPRFVGVSVIRGASSTGRIVETRDGVDRSRAIVLTATGHGATITVDLQVWP